MESIIPQTKQEKISEKNLSHTENEWEEFKVRQNDSQIIIPLYKMIWETIPE